MPPICSPDRSVARERSRQRAIDASVEEWLMEDVDQITLKKWVTEALATAEEIPLELARAIIEWEPQVQKRVQVRREAA
jgi:hypothetical protein